MTKIDFKKAFFVVTAVHAKGYPPARNMSGQIMPEIAVAGRSNVGKSSLLNNLFQQKDLVKTSSTPGKTQAINFFNVDDTLSFVDLPGYGYAQVPVSVRKKWGPMVQEYLQKRDNLKLILFLFDIRRMPNEDDQQFLSWIVQANKAAILVFTKVDKLKKNEINANTKKILAAFNAENLHYVHYSVPKNIGRKELITMLLQALKSEEGEGDEG